MSTTGSLVFMITGCSSGLGKEMAFAALERGHRVIGTVRREDQLSILQDKGGVGLLLDITSSEETLNEFAAKAISQYGHVDVLINNAGSLRGGSIEETTLAEARSQFDNLFFGVMGVTNAFLPHFRERKSGTIINISSFGSVTSTPGAGVYCAAKAAVDSLSDTLAQELAQWNVRCVSIQLGWFNTDMARKYTPTAKFGTIEGYTSAHAYGDLITRSVGKEPGDTIKAANRIVEIALRPGSLPLRIPMGDDAVLVTRKKAEKLAKEAAEWSVYGQGLNRAVEDIGDMTALVPV